MKKKKPIKIRRTWGRHPAERIKEDAPKILNACELCGLFEEDPAICRGCEYDEPLGGA
jgi:hypothetical protein